MRRKIAELDLPGERLFAHPVPALVELTLVFGDPILTRVVRRFRVENHGTVAVRRTAALGAFPTLAGRLANA
jgi:hypothetical protein